MWVGGFLRKSAPFDSILTSHFFSKKTHRTCRKSTPLFASKPVGSNFPGHGHPFSHTKTKKFTWEVVPARGPNRGATPSGTSTNSLYRAVLSRGSLLHIIRRFAFTILRNRPHACTHASHLPIAMGGTLYKFKFDPNLPPFIASRLF